MISIRNQLLVLAAVATASIWGGAFLQYRLLKTQTTQLTAVRHSLAAASFYVDAERLAGQERGITNGWLLEPARAEDPTLLAARRRLDRSLMQLTQFLTRDGGVLPADVRAWTDQLGNMRTQVDMRAVRAADVFSFYTRLVDDVDDKVARRYAEGMLAVALPYEHVLAMQRATEFMARMRGTVNGALHANVLAATTRDALNRQRALYDEALRTFRRAAPGAPPLAAPAVRASLDYIDRLLAQQSLAAIDLAPAAWWSLATEAVQAHHAAVSTASAALRHEADSRMLDMDVRLNRTVIALVVLGLLTLALVLSTVGRIVLGLQRLLAGLRDVVEGGNFSTRIHGNARDEFGVISTGINTLIEEASNSVDAHEARSLTDALTGLLNRRGFDLQLHARTAYSRTHTVPLCLIMLDIDHFKSVNDTFGHPSGDMVLRQLAGVLQLHLRPDDVVARLGGEEFVALLPGCPLAEGMMVAEKLRAAVAAHDFQIGRQVTASFGVAPWRASQAPDQLIAAADACLYASKHAGRNRVSQPAH